MRLTLPGDPEAAPTLPMSDLMAGSRRNSGALGRGQLGDQRGQALVQSGILFFKEQGDLLDGIEVGDIFDAQHGHCQFKY